MAITSMLSTSLTGMKAAQAQLEVIGRNIANVDTPGYTRKTLAQNSVISAGQPFGVATGNVARQVSEGLLKSFMNSNSMTGSLTKKNEYLSKMDMILGTPLGDNSIASSISRLQTSFNDFASDVTSASNRYSLMSTADSIASRINSLTTQIQKLRGDADMEISGVVTEVNTKLDELARLNDEIVKYTVLGYDGLADLEDKRDQALRDLSGMIDISYFKRENGEIVIQTKEGVQLLDRDPHHLSHNSIAQGNSTVNYGNGISGIYVDGKDITNMIRDGSLKGLIEVRDNTLTNLQIQLDELTVTLKDTINQIHNRGSSYPQSPSKMVGDRTFIDSSTQGIKIENGDVRFIIFDKDGNQVATTTLGGDLGFAGGSIDSMAAAIEAWMASPSGANLPLAKAGVDANGNFVISTNDSEYTISILDVASSTPGSEQKDAGISFDVNGDGVYDRSYEGFSNFFKLNDFFQGSPVEDIFDTRVLDRSANLGVTSVTELEFSDITNGVGYASIKVYPNDSLQSIADRINNDASLSGSIQAILVPNGSGVQLRIMHISGEQFEINEKAPGSGLLNRLGMHPSSTGASADIGIRDDFRTNPGLISGGMPEFNVATGQYDMNPASNKIATNLASAFNQAISFKQAGNISDTKTTLSNYAATFVGVVASLSSSTTSSLAYQSELTNSIATKEAQISGVDMDEELGMMIMFQQSYAASAKSFTAAKEMLDMLLNLV